MNVGKCFSRPKLNTVIDQCAQKIPTGQYQKSGIHRLTAGGVLIRFHQNQFEHSG